MYHTRYVFMYEGRNQNNSYHRQHSECIMWPVFFIHSVVKKYIGTNTRKTFSDLIQISLAFRTRTRLNKCFLREIKRHPLQDKDNGNNGCRCRSVVIPALISGNEY